MFFPGILRALLRYVRPTRAANVPTRACRVALLPATLTCARDTDLPTTPTPGGAPRLP